MGAWATPRCAQLALWVTVAAIVAVNIGLVVDALRTGLLPSGAGTYAVGAVVLVMYVSLLLALLADALLGSRSPLKIQRGPGDPVLGAARMPGRDSTVAMP